MDERGAFGDVVLGYLELVDDDLLEVGPDVGGGPGVEAVQMFTKEEMHRSCEQVRWARVPGVTLLGDAAHLMAPSGEGANLAMYDGAELGKAIATHSENVEAALLAYEERLFPRSAVAAAEAAELTDILLGEDSPQSLVDMLNTGQSGSESSMQAN